MRTKQVKKLESTSKKSVRNIGLYGETGGKKRKENRTEKNKRKEKKRAQQQENMSLLTHTIDSQSAIVPRT
jgi:hypothetical protein